MEDKIIFSAAVQQINRLILAEISRFRDLEAGAAQPFAGKLRPAQFCG